MGQDTCILYECVLDVVERTSHIYFNFGESACVKIMHMDDSCIKDL